MMNSLEPHKRTTEEFIDLSKNIHDDLYDYSKVIYINNRTPVLIICPLHGAFLQRPEHHLNGSGCPDCKKCKRMNTVLFIKKSNIVHLNFYDYSKVIYINNKTLVDIVCPLHGIFQQRPDSHLNGRGCSLCGQKKSADSQRKLLDIFISESNKKHGYKYDYQNAVYTGAHKKLKIICLKHGEFEQTPNSHLRGCGCLICAETNGERIIRVFLQEQQIDFISQKTFIDCKYKNLLKFDFYLIKQNICIEFDGKQHFSPYYIFGGEKALEIQKIKDNIKNKYCKDNNIKLLRISYLDNVIEKLNEFFTKFLE